MGRGQSEIATIYHNDNSDEFDDSDNLTMAPNVYRRPVYDIAK